MYADLYLTQMNRRYDWIQSSLLVILSSLLIALFGFAAVRFPFSPVPIALQPHLILLLSFLLGSRLAPLAISLFLFYGAVGFPVFAGGGCGILWFFGPTGGYLIGYLLASFAVGFLAEQKGNHSPLRAFTIMAVGNLIIFLCGVSYLSSLIGITQAILLGFLPFLMGDALKLLAAVQIFKLLREDASQ